MRLQDFRATVDADAIRVQCDWQALLKLNPQASLNTVKVADAANLYCPWYVGADGEIEFAEARHKPLRIWEVEQQEHLLKPERRAVLHEMRGQALLTKPVPCYALPNNTALLMDGNHRIASAFMFNEPLTFYALIIEGPLDSSLLPDLRFWS